MVRIPKRRGQMGSVVLRQAVCEAMEGRVLLSVMFVDANPAVPGQRDGSDWNHAYADLAPVLNGAVAGDVIRVADGTYKPTTTTTRTISFQLKTGVGIYGGYAGYGASNPEARDVATYPSVLSGDIGTAGSITDNSYHVVNGSGTDNTAVLDGFTITGSNANGYNSFQQSGGGVYNSYGSPMLANCTFTGNTTEYGAGIFNSSSSPTLINCAFFANVASAVAGGMYNSGSSNPTLTNCTFNGNPGGGMYNDLSSPTLTNCTFIGNSATNGGGISNTGSTCLPTLINCVFIGNLTNTNGPAMSNYASAAPTLVNCIIWGSGDTPIYNNASTPVITYSDIQGGYAGTGNINVDPLFVRSPWTGPDGLFGTADDDYGDLHLRPGSPVLDIGSNAAIPIGVSTDLAGNARIQNGTVDLGVYEGSVVAPVPKAVYVDLTAVGANTGTSWSDAFKSLQSALSVAGDGDIIRVAQGAYKPTANNDRTLGFALRNAVALYGGFAGNRASDPNSRDRVAYTTVLSGDIGTGGVASDNSYHVLTATVVGSSTVLDGFTVTGGNANAVNAYGSYRYNGGGLLVNGCSPTISNCNFIRNVAQDNGGGMCSQYISSPTLINCTFSGNSCSNGGGGICNQYNSSPTLTNCTFLGNVAPGGGGMYGYGSCNPTLTNCAFIGNSTTSTSSGGGGMYNWTSCSPTLTNCTFIGNSATFSGGGMYNSSSSNPTLTNCTLSGNTAAGSAYNAGGAGIYNTSTSNPKLTNCIIWGSGNSPIYNSSSTPVISYSDIQGGYTGTGNISADPLFVRAPWTGSDGLFGTADDDYDLRLRPASPALDIGSNTVVPAGVTTDLAGNVRIQNGTVDLGAYEGSIAVPAAKTFYVDLASVGGNTGASWADAFTSLQSALSAAADGDTIRVAHGIYKPTISTNRSLGFALRNAVALNGGYAGYGASNPDARDPAAYATILSGDIGVTGTTTDNSYHVLTASGAGNATSLDGVTVTGGYANGSGINQTYGGGLFGSASFLTLKDCTFSGNSADTNSSGLGAAIYNYASSPIMTNCMFNGNTSYRGAMANLRYSSPTLTNCTFTGNTAAYHGGAMFNSVYSSPTLTSCTFLSNTAAIGGGIYDNSSANPTLTNCTFSGNSATGASGYGGGIYNVSSNPKLINCTLSGNSASTYGGGMYSADSTSPTLTNCIVWGNGNSPIYNTNSVPAITYSDIQQASGIYTGTGNINADPLFVRNPSGSDYGDLRLKPTSPCIDAGSNAAIPAGITTDLVGNTRVIDYPGVRDPGAIVDMGAYERQLPLAVGVGGNTTIIVGSGLVRSGAFTDADITDALTATVNYGDGGGIVPLALNADKTFNLSHTYDGTGLYTVTVNGVSSNNGLATGSFNVTVLPPLVTQQSFSVNAGAAQRSEVTQVQVTFDQPVTLSAGAITLGLRNSGGSGANNGSAPTDRSSLLVIMASADRRTYTISFAGSLLDPGLSLKDGIYDLVVHGAGVRDDFGRAMAADKTNTFHRLFGDANGDRIVDGVDLALFRLAANKSAGQAGYQSFFDFDGNGTITTTGTGSDYAQFVARYGRKFIY